MALDVNRFDTWLKDMPFRDLIFRSGIWLILSAAASAFAISGGLAPIEFLVRMAEGSGPLLNSVGTIALAMAAAALCLKDLEAVAPDTYGQMTLIGSVGGGVRRVAGDLMLWTLGAFMTLLSTLVVALFLTSVEPAQRKVALAVVVLLLITTAVIAVLTYFVRRAGPTPVTQLTATPWVIICGYCVAFAGTAAYVYWKHAA